MDMGRFLIETHLRTGRPIKELAAAHEVSASWLFKLARRYRLEGAVGLEPRSRRPHHCPTRVANLFEEEIVVLHKTLADDGLDAGAQTVHYHLSLRHEHPPSVSTVFRVLKARGFVTFEPHKRPKSSLTRFAADVPNECWQADMTHWQLADDTEVEIVNFIDDYSRMVVAIEVHHTIKAEDVRSTFRSACERYGTPASMLTDNGAIFNAVHRGGRSGFKVTCSPSVSSTNTPPPTTHRPAEKSSAGTRR